VLRLATRTFPLGTPSIGKIWSMEITHLFAGVSVTDFAAACQWYERLFGRPADMLPREGEAVWRLTSGGSIYVVEDLERAGTGLLTIALVELAAPVSSTDEPGSAPRRVILNDPDGNTITLFQDPAQR
jgi:hypothetical protein